MSLRYNEETYNDRRDPVFLNNSQYTNNGEAFDPLIIKEAAPNNIFRENFNSTTIGTVNFTPSNNYRLTKIFISIRGVDGATSNTFTTNLNLNGTLLHKCFIAVNSSDNSTNYSLDIDQNLEIKTTDQISIVISRRVASGSAESNFTFYGEII